MKGWFLLGLAGFAGKKIADFEEIYRAGQPYRQNIESAAEIRKIPAALLMSILWKESRFNSNAKGSAGEIGMGQFKKVAADDVGVDFEALKSSPKLQISAAATYLDLNRDRLGSLWDSTRAYNVGPGAARSDPAAGFAYALSVWINTLSGVMYEKIARQVGIA